MERTLRQPLQIQLISFWIIAGIIIDFHYTNQLTPH